MNDRLGVIAGAGDLPWRVADAARRQGRPVFILGLEGAVDAARGPDAVVRLGAAGAAIARLKAEGVRELVMAGGVRRPSLAELRPDWRATKLFARAGVRALGDDGLLRAVIGELEAEGFVVRAPQDFLGAEDLAPVGVWTRRSPDAQAQADLARALAVARALGAVDVGQGAVAQDGVVLAVEAIEGTDAMLARVAGLARAGAGGVLVKAAKPGQEERADWPTIGVGTVRAAQAAGLRGVGVLAGAAVVADRPATIAAADAAGLFLIGLSADE